MKDELIIHFGGSTRGEWKIYWQREQELVTRISKDNKVLYIERLGLMTRKPFDLMKRLWNRVKRNSGAKISNENLIFYFPFLIPIYGMPFIRKLNSFLLSLQIKRKLRSLNLSGKKPIIWVKNPAEYVQDVLPKLSRKLVIYDCHHVYFPGMVEKGKELDEKIALAADLVFADSTAIYEGKAKLNQNTYHIPQGVSLSFFKQRRENDNGCPQELKPIKPPLIGYIGFSHPSFDFDLIPYLADKKPNWSFILIGNIVDREARFSSRSNIHLLGSRKHEEIPNYLEHFDVCIIPYLVNEYTKAVFPTKLFEYMAACKPIISTYLPDLVRYKKFVKIAENYEEFLTQIENCLREKDENRESDFYSLLEDNTWDKRIEEIYRIISIHLSSEKCNSRQKQSSSQLLERNKSHLLEKGVL